jgi:acetolactate synthase-1/2/3 large subunit
VFPGLRGAADIGQLTAALSFDGPSVFSAEYSPNEIPPFAPFLTPRPSHEEDESNVAASA